MTVWKVLLAIFLILFLIGRIKLGGMVEYSAQGLLVKLRFGALWFRLYPGKQREEKKTSKKKKEKKEKRHMESKEEPEAKKGGSLALVKQYLPLVGEAAGGMRERIVIDRLYLDFVAASQDAAGAAMAFGYANMAIGMLWPIFEQNFLVREHRFRTDVDFSAQSPTIYLNVALSIRVGQLISLALRLLWCFFRLYRQGKRMRNA